MLWIVRANLYKQLHHKQTQHLFEYLDLSPINRKQQAQLINSLLKFQAHFFLLFLLFFSYVDFVSLALYENRVQPDTHQLFSKFVRKSQKASAARRRQCANGKPSEEQRDGEKCENWLFGRNIVNSVWVPNK